MLSKTIPERRFRVRDDRGRDYRVTRYVWLESETESPAESDWKEVWEVLMTDNGGILERAGDGCYIVDGTNTPVRGSMEERV